MFTFKIIFSSVHLMSRLSVSFQATVSGIWFVTMLAFVIFLDCMNVFHVCLQSFLWYKCLLANFTFDYFAIWIHIMSFLYSPIGPLRGPKIGLLSKIFCLWMEFAETQIRTYLSTMQSFIKIGGLVSEM